MMLIGDKTLIPVDVKSFLAFPGLTTGWCLIGLHEIGTEITNGMKSVEH